MTLSDLLLPDATRNLASASSKKRLFHALGDVAAQVYHLSADRVVEAVMEREALGPTGVGQGVALPHARLPDLPRVCGIFLRLEKAVDYGAVDGQPVDLVFALFAPTAAGVDHLKALASVSRSLRDPELCAKLRANDNPATLYTVLTAGRASYAA